MFPIKFKAKAATSGAGIWSPFNGTASASSSFSNLSDLKSEPPTPPPLLSTTAIAIATSTTTAATTTASSSSSLPSIIWTPQSSPISDQRRRQLTFRPIQFESPKLSRKFPNNSNQNLNTSSLSLDTIQSSSSCYNHNINNDNDNKNVNNIQNNDSINVDHNNTKRITRNDSNKSIDSQTINIKGTIIQKKDSGTNGDGDSGYGGDGVVAKRIKTFERSCSATEINQKSDTNKATYKPNEIIYDIKHEYMSEPETLNDYPKKMAKLSRHHQCDGIGPVTNDGMPIILRSEVKQPHQHEWYKRLYQTIHKQKHGDDYIISYKCPKVPIGRHLYNKRVTTSGGYQSEPDINDSSYSTIKYRATNPQRLLSASSTINVRNSANANDCGHNVYGILPKPIKSSSFLYKNQPGRIENYTTGHSSISEKERQQWRNEIMDIFNVQFEQTKPTFSTSQYTDGYLARALSRESGYTSDSNLVYRKKDIKYAAQSPSQLQTQTQTQTQTQSQTQLHSPLSPSEQKLAYKCVQAGGEPPLYGFRKAAPEKPKVSPNRYYESDVNIHFKTPICHEFKTPIPEGELIKRQNDYLEGLYQEERRRKYLQELQDMNARRHTDNFMPSQKSPIPLNRYDDFPADLAPKTHQQQQQQKSCVTIAKALYNFQGQNARELSFKKGDIIYIRRSIDKNWYEGEHNAMLGIFPANYVEIISKDGVNLTKHIHVQQQQHQQQQQQQQPPRKPSEGQARAKYNFQAQSGIELSLNKGELVALTRRVDENWFEGRIANRKGIFPVSYVEVLTDIGAEDIAARTVVTQQQQQQQQQRPSTLDGLRSNHQHHTHHHHTNDNNLVDYNNIMPNEYSPLTATAATTTTTNGILKGDYHKNKTDILHVDTTIEPLVYRVLYKYRPQNSDELELCEGDLVYVLEKCDDGWFVGTSQRTGCFGTFPGNYVERL